MKRAVIFRSYRALMAVYSLVRRVVTVVPTIVSNIYNNSIAIVPNISLSARLQNYNLIEYIDLIAKSLDPFRKPAIDGNT